MTMHIIDKQPATFWTLQRRRQLIWPGLLFMFAATILETFS